MFYPIPIELYFIKVRNKYEKRLKIVVNRKSIDFTASRYCCYCYPVW